MRLEPRPGLPVPGQPGIFWLGQAGFWIETGQHRLLIDPYLSDSLGKKYAGQANDHRRMMPPPVGVQDLPRPDLVLVTHAHTDHMDPETLAPLARRFPDLPFVIPEARSDIARTRIGGRLVGMDADESLSPLPGLKITALPAAHEDFDRDALGRHPFLGYVIEVPGLAIWHSGDCIPYPGLSERLADLAPDIALMPVNGRGHGVPGNFTLDEALDLAATIPFLVAHHWGMFAFNTLDPARIDQAALTRPGLLRPKAGETLAIL